MSVIATEIGLSAARVGPLVKRAEVATLSRTACFFRVVAAGEYHRLRISLTGGTTYMRFPAFGPVGPCGLRLEDYVAGMGGDSGLQTCLARLMR